MKTFSPNSEPKCARGAPRPAAAPRTGGGEERKARLNIQESGLIQDWGCRAALGVGTQTPLPPGSCRSGEIAEGQPGVAFPAAELFVGSP